MTTSAVNTGASATAAAQSSTSSAAQSLAGNFDTFLQLLTAQLQHQDPTSPMDTSQFTNQLVEFAGVEQQIDINKNLETMLQNQDNTSMATASTYIGQQATGVTTSLPLQSSKAQFAYTTPAGTKSVSIVISDSAGNIVATQTGSADQGTHVGTWDGKDFSGTLQKDGAYTINVNAVGTDGGNTTLDTAITGLVTGVGTDPTTNQTELFMGGVGMDLSSVIEVQAAGSTVDTGTVSNAIDTAQSAAAAAAAASSGS